MKDIYELIRQKEGDLERIQREIDALKLSARLLEDSNRTPAVAAAASAATTIYSPTPKPSQPTATPAAWASAKQFP